MVESFGKNVSFVSTGVKTYILMPNDAIRFVIARHCVTRQPDYTI